MRGGGYVLSCSQQYVWLQQCRRHRGPAQDMHIIMLIPELVMDWQVSQLDIIAPAAMRPGGQ